MVDKIELDWQKEIPLRRRNCERVCEAVRKWCGA